MSDYQPNQCVSMGLEVNPITSNQFDLYLSLKFTPQWQNIGRGRLLFSLHGGKLRVKLENAQMLSIITQPQLGWHLISTESTGELTWLVQLSPSPNTDRFKLGTFECTGINYDVIASLSIIPRFLSFKDIEGLWRHDLSPNKHGILDRQLAIFLCENILSGDICSVNLAEDSPIMAKLELNQDSIYELEEFIEKIYNVKTDNFTELMNIAGLNPLEDLAGGNFLATQVNGIQLNGANLSHSVWRGADLTDADLSETDLSDGNLAGADLSGAYLGNANLQRADLHRASLALANLIGANLSNANLRETNLSNTNLSGAIVSGAVFHHNTGLTEEERLSLQQRNAVVE